MSWRLILEVSIQITAVNLDFALKEYVSNSKGLKSTP